MVFIFSAPHNMLWRGWSLEWHALDLRWLGWDLHRTACLLAEREVPLGGCERDVSEVFAESIPLLGSACVAWVGCGDIGPLLHGFDVLECVMMFAWLFICVDKCWFGLFVCVCWFVLVCVLDLLDGLLVRRLRYLLEKEGTMWLLKMSELMNSLRRFWDVLTCFWKREPNLVGWSSEKRGFLNDESWIFGSYVKEQIFRGRKANEARQKGTLEVNSDYEAPNTIEFLYIIFIYNMPMWKLNSYCEDQHKRLQEMSNQPVGTWQWNSLQRVFPTDQTSHNEWLDIVEMNGLCQRFRSDRNILWTHFAGPLLQNIKFSMCFSIFEKENPAAGVKRNLLYSYVLQEHYSFMESTNSTRFCDSWKCC